MGSATAPQSRHGCVPTGTARSCLSCVCGHLRRAGGRRQEARAGAQPPCRHGRRRLRRCRHRRAGARRGCAFLLAQHFLFSVKTGPQRRCKYRSAMPRISGKPASKKQPSCSSSRCVQIHRKQNLQHILMWLNARSKSHLEILLPSLSAWGRSHMPRTLNH